MYSIEKKLVIHSSMQKVWSGLSNSQYIGEWMELGEPVKMDFEIGGYFSFFGGRVIGRFLEIIPPDILAYTLRGTDWNPHWPDSYVRFELRDLGRAVELRLTHEGLPNETERTEQDLDWDTFFLEPMKEWAETAQRGLVFGIRPLRRVEPMPPKPEQ